MSVSVSQLLGKKQKIADAEHTLKIALDAARDGNLRLAISRGITAIIQASAAAVGAAPPVVHRAEVIVQTVRNVIQGAIVKKLTLGMMEGRQAQSFWDRPWGGTKRARAVPKHLLPPTGLPELIKFPGAESMAPEWDPATEKWRRFPAIPEGAILPSKNSFAIHTFLTEMGVPPKKMTLLPDGVHLWGQAVKQAETILTKVTKLRPDLSKRFFGTTIRSKNPFALHTFLVKYGVPAEKMTLRPDGITLWGAADKQAQTILATVTKTMPELSQRFFDGLGLVSLGYLMRAV